MQKQSNLIRVDTETKQALESLKIHANQSINEVVVNLLDMLAQTPPKPKEDNSHFSPKPPIPILPIASKESDSPGKKTNKPEPLQFPKPLESDSRPSLYKSDIPEAPKG